MLFRLISMVGSARNARDAVASARGSVAQVKTAAGELQAASLQRTVSKAEAGDRSAQYDLGEHFYDGRGVEKDHEQAFGWFLKAAAQGHGRSQVNVGMMLCLGRGTDKDPVAGCEWLSKAAEAGVAGAGELLEKAKRRLGGEG